MEKYRDRDYRKKVQASDLVSFHVTVKETDLFVSADRNLEHETRDLVINYRHQLENYILSHQDFLTTLQPYPDDPYSPPIVREMIRNTRGIGVGPMASVAGAVAEFVGMKNLFEASFQGGSASIQGHQVVLSRRLDHHHRHVAIRPEDITVSIDAFSLNRKNIFPGNVAAVASQGFTYEVHVRTGDITFKALVTKKSLIDLGLREGLDVFISFEPASVHTF